MSAVFTRFTEVAAASSVETIAKRLMAACCVESGKVYNRQREQRLAVWRELQAVAERQVMALESEGATTRKRVPRVKAATPATTSTEVPITVASAT